jgi:AraC family transcriptional regulator, ethanolamine operon transcriptional activator
MDEFGGICSSTTKLVDFKTLYNYHSSMSIRKPQEIGNDHDDELRSEVFPGGLVLNMTTSDFDEMSAAAPRWDQEYLKLGTGPFKGRLLGFHTSRVQVGIVSWEPGILSRGSAPRQATTLAMLLGKGGATSFQGTILDENQIVLLKPGQEFELSAMGKSRLLVIVVEQALLSSHTQTKWGDASIVTDSRDRLFVEHPSNRNGFYRMWESLMRDVAGHSRLLAQSFFARYLEQSVLEDLLAGARSPKTLPLGPKRYQAAKKAKEYLFLHAEDAVSITELCKATNSTERTLLLGFHELFGMAPKSYLKALRLNRVRQHLTGASHETTVTEVAIRWGFTHLSRFAADYRLMFGELPRETLRSRQKTLPKQ